MTRSRLILPSLGVVLAGTAMIAAAAAPAATRDWRVSGFDKVDLTAAATVQIRNGADFAVHADGDQDLIRQLDIHPAQGTLIIGWVPGQGPRRIGNRRLTITVTMPRISGATVTGAGMVSIDRAEASNFSARVGGAGTLKVAALRTGRASLDVSGAGTLDAAGSADRVIANMSGVGSIRAGTLTARAGQIDMSGTGSVTARIDGPAEVTLSGIGSVNILGRPQCVVHKSGWGSVRCGATS